MEKNIRSLISKFEVLSNSIANQAETPKPTRPRFNFSVPKAPVPKEKIPETPKETPTFNSFYKNNNAKLNEIQLEISKMLNEISTLSEIPVETFINILQTLVQHLITLGSIDAEGNYNLKQKKAACFQKIQECNAEIMKGRKYENEEPKSINIVREIEKEAFEDKIYKEREEEEKGEEIEVVQFKSVRQMKSMFDTPSSPMLPKSNLWKSSERFGSCGSINGSTKELSTAPEIVKAKSAESISGNSLEVVEIEEKIHEEVSIVNDKEVVRENDHVQKSLVFEKFEEKKEVTVPTIEIQAATPMTPLEKPQEFPNLKSVSLIKHYFEPQSKDPPTNENVEKNAKLNKLIKELEVESEDEEIAVESVAVSENENNIINSDFEKICDNLESDVEDLFEDLVNEETTSSYVVDEMSDNKESGGEYSSLESSEAESVINLNSPSKNKDFVNINFTDEISDDRGDTIGNDEETEADLQSVEHSNDNRLRYPVQICPQAPDGYKTPEDSNKVESATEEEVVHRIKICPTAPEDYKAPDFEVNYTQQSEEYSHLREMYKKESLHTKSLEDSNISSESRIAKQIVELKRSQSEQSLDGLDEIDEVFAEITKYRLVIDKFDPKKDLSKFDELEMQLYMLLVRIEKIKTKNNEQLENMKLDGVKMIGEIIETFHAKV